MAPRSLRTRYEFVPRVRTLEIPLLAVYWDSGLIPPGIPELWNCCSWFTEKGGTSGRNGKALGARCAVFGTSRVFRSMSPPWTDHIITLTLRVAATMNMQSVSFPQMKKCRAVQRFRLLRRAFVEPSRKFQFSKMMDSWLALLAY